MPAKPLDKAVHQLCQAALKAGTELTDAQLLGHFIEHRDEAAFSVLVRRHGPVVWGVCRRIAGHHQDAEDAFQATFLVLARKAGSVRPRQMVASWLHGVARRTALKAKAMAGRRQRREKQVALLMPEPKSASSEPWRCLEPLLDQELARLPDKYRIAIVLCDLENKTGREAARQLSIPEGTLASRLRTARALLAKRLGRHGLPLAGAALALALSQNGATASAPSAIMSATIKAAPLVAAGQTVAKCAMSPTVAALTEGVLKIMLLTKAKLIVGALMLMVAIGAGGVVTSLTEAGAKTGERLLSQQVTREEPVKQPGANQELAGITQNAQSILKNKRDAAQKVWDLMIKKIDEGRAAVDSSVLDWHKRYMEAEMELVPDAKGRIAILARHWLMLKKVEEDSAQKMRAGTEDPAIYAMVQYHRLAVEEQYVKLKTKFDKR